MVKWVFKRAGGPERDTERLRPNGFLVTVLEVRSPRNRIRTRIQRP